MRGNGRLKTSTMAAAGGRPDGPPSRDMVLTATATETIRPILSVSGGGSVVGAVSVANGVPPSSRSRARATSVSPFSGKKRLPLERRGPAGPSSRHRPSIHDGTGGGSVAGARSREIGVATVVDVARCRRRGAAVFGSSGFGS